MAAESRSPQVPKRAHLERVICGWGGPHGWPRGSSASDNSSRGFGDRTHRSTPGLLPSKHQLSLDQGRTGPCCPPGARRQKARQTLQRVGIGHSQETSAHLALQCVWLRLGQDAPLETRGANSGRRSSWGPSRSPLQAPGPLFAPLFSRPVTLTSRSWKHWPCRERP